MLSSRRRRILARILIAIVIIAAAIAIVLRIIAASDPLRAAERRQWKEQAIARITAHRADAQRFQREYRELQNEAAAPQGSLRLGGWARPNLIVLRNGDWILIESICRKSNKRIADLFIGLGSDGRWYYSTFHFCVGLSVLYNEPQPESLAQFVDGYWLKPFDGRSDDCLRKTWDDQPYGDAKRAMDSPR